MTVTSKVLTQGRYVPAVLTNVYTANELDAIVDQFTAVNIGGSNVALTIHLVPLGGTAVAENRIMGPREIAPGQTYLLSEAMGHVIANGGTIWAVASVADAISIRVSGREITSP